MSRGAPFGTIEAGVVLDAELVTGGRIAVRIGSCRREYVAVAETKDIRPFAKFLLKLCDLSDELNAKGV